LPKKAKPFFVSSPSISSLIAKPSTLGWGSLRSPQPTDALEMVD